jgi:hypothetical protein
MIAPWPRVLVALPLGLSLVVATALVHCGTRVYDAVGFSEGGQLDEAAMAGLMLDGGAMVDTGTMSPPFDSGMPNPLGDFTNSSSDLVTGHDTITELRPNVLLLNFCNGLDQKEAEQRAKTRIENIRESSRYHGFNTGSPVFLDYQLVQPVMDLTDPPTDAGADASKIGSRDGGVGGGFPGHGGFGRGNPSKCESSSRLPVDQSGSFDMKALFARTDFYDQLDPNNSHYLCQLFESGIINELWILSGDTQSRPPLLWESRRMYDDRLNKTGQFTTQTGETSFPSNLACNVTVRVAYEDPNGGACDLVGLSIGMENLHFAIPYLATNAKHFFNLDLPIRDKGMAIDSWDDLVALGNNGGPGLIPGRAWCTSPQTACISYPSNNAARVTFPPPDTTTFALDPLNQGCGTAHFPPNARFKWDWSNNQSVLSTCEHYLMQDGIGGSDIMTPYSNSDQSVAQYTQQAAVGNGCGGGWQIYLRQNMPGYGARAADGSLIKNWWPFLFY